MPVSTESYTAQLNYRWVRLHHFHNGNFRRVLDLQLVLPLMVLLHELEVIVLLCQQLPKRG